MLNRVREFVPGAGANVRKTHEGLQTLKKNLYRHHTRGKYSRRVTQVVIIPEANTSDESHTSLSHQWQIFQTSHTCYHTRGKYTRRVIHVIFIRGEYTRRVTHVVIIPEANTPDQSHMSLSYQRQIHQTSYTCRYHTRGKYTRRVTQFMSLSYQRQIPSRPVTHVVIIPEAHSLLQTISHTCRYPHIRGMHALQTIEPHILLSYQRHIAYCRQ